MCFPVGAATLDEALRVAIAVAVQRLRDMRVCPDPAHLFVDVLAKVGHVEDATPIVEAPLPVEVYTDEDEFSMAEKDLAVLAAESHTNGAHSVSSFVRVGHAPNEITKAAKDLDVDLIIIATHGYTSWRYFCIGSTTERVVRTASCPVLVVREKEHEFV